MKKTAYYLFLTALIFSPMAFGTVEIWSYLIMEVIICTSALLLFFSSNKKTFYQCHGILPLILVNAFLLFQLIPLPGYFVKILSPSTYEIFLSASGLTDKMGWISLSIYPRATLMECLRFSTYVLFYIIAIQFFAERSLLKKTVTVIAWFAALLSLVAIIEFITESLDYPLAHNKIFWLKELSHGGTPMGPYVNRNHYAGLMEMIFPLVLSMFFVFRPRLTKLSLKRKIADFFNHKRINQHLFYGTAAILIATSILLSLSRGGILSLSISMIIFSALILFKAKQKKTGFFIGFIVIVILLLTGTSGWDAIFKRFENIQNQSGLIYDDRLIIWEDSIKIFRDFPLVGTGTGTFEKIYPLYRSFPGNDILEHAHNDFLEFFCTGGVVLPVLMGWCLFSILYSAGGSFIKRREWYSVLLFSGCITSISAILLHSLVDFNMQVGANGLYFFFVLALAVSAANTRMRPGLAPTYLQQTKKHSYLTKISATFLLLSIFYVHGGTLLADFHFAKYRNIPLTSETSKKTLLKIHQTAKTAAAYDMMNPVYHHIVANTASLLQKDSAALKYYTR
jgi:O-antigen ligase